MMIATCPEHIPGKKKLSEGGLSREKTFVFPNSLAYDRIQNTPGDTGLTLLSIISTKSIFIIMANHYS
jgi:hypothetical protein